MRGAIPGRRSRGAAIRAARAANGGGFFGCIEAAARTAIAAIVADAESAFDDEALWPAHPLDEDGGPLRSPTSLYLGASGVIWALDELERVEAAELTSSWATTAVALHERYVANPDFKDELGLEGPVPSLLAVRVVNPLVKAFGM